MKKILAAILILHLGSLVFWQAYSNANERLAIERAAERGRQIGEAEVVLRLFQQGVEIPGDVDFSSINSDRNVKQHSANERELWNDIFLYVPAWGLAGVSIVGLLGLLLSGRTNAAVAGNAVKAMDSQKPIPSRPNKQEAEQGGSYDGEQAAHF
jgi:hypothetical protein